MRAALREARRAADDVPVGAVVLDPSGQVIGAGHNERERLGDPTAHAEIVAIRRASAKLKTFDLAGCEMYINGPPCCMCMGSILWARIDRVYYALSMEASKEVGLSDDHLYAELARPLVERRIVPMISFPDLDQEALAVYREWLAKPDRVRY